MDMNIIYDEMRRLDKISGLDTRNIPVRISSRMTKGWGSCRYCYERRKYQIKELVFAKRLLERGTMEHILNVVRHEYAHAYVTLTYNHHHGHDAVWKRVALWFGCNAKRCENFDEVDSVYKYKVICRGCGSESRYQRKAGIVKELEVNPDSTRFYCCKCHSHKFILEKVSNS